MICFAVTLVPRYPRSGEASRSKHCICRAKDCLGKFRFLLSWLLTEIALVPICLLTTLYFLVLKQSPLEIHSPLPYCAQYLETDTPHEKMFSRKTKKHIWNSSWSFKIKLSLTIRQQYTLCLGSTTRMVFFKNLFIPKTDTGWKTTKNFLEHVENFYIYMFCNQNERERDSDLQYTYIKQTSPLKKKPEYLYNNTSWDSNSMKI